MSPGVVSLVASPGASPVAINLRRRATMPQCGGDCAAAILPTTLRDLGVGA
ncbi:MAG TPA: hypothetical protein VFN85_09160 [Solirubrobacterales bacterium]|nr:hypothetical protein [Solirubrobacterales bacterium]